MKSLERRFNNIAENFPIYSAFACLAQAVKGQNFSRKVVRKWFMKLVPKDDYSRDEARQLVSHLAEISKVV